MDDSKFEDWVKTLLVKKPSKPFVEFNDKQLSDRQKYLDLLLDEILKRTRVIQDKRGGSINIKLANYDAEASKQIKELEAISKARRSSRI